MALQRGADASLSNNEREFIAKALRGEQRLDGRGPFDYRSITFNFALDGSSCTLHMGATRVMAVVTAALEAPYPDRASEGSLRFSVELSPMASPAFEAGRPGEAAVELGRLIERGLRESRAIDLEALCVQAGRAVWALRVDVVVLDHGGNLADACGLAALAALCSFRRPDAAADADGAVVVHSPANREPLPLTIHHLPLPVSFALFDEGRALVADASLAEEAASEGSFTVAVNPQGEVCAVHKAHGAGLSPSQVLRCVRIAAAKAKELAALMRAALDAHEVARVAARVRRRAGTPLAPGAAAGGAPADGRSVLVLRGDQLAAGPPAARPPREARAPAELHAAAEDADHTQNSEGSAEALMHESGEDGREEELAREGGAEASTMLQDEDVRPTAGMAAAGRAAEPAVQEPPATKAKRRRTAAGGGAVDADPFASIAELIAAAGGKGGGEAADLNAAVKRKGSA